MTDSIYQTFETVIDELPVVAQRHFRRGLQWLERGELGWAEQSFEQALIRAPDHPRLLQAQAEVVQRLGRPAQAVELLRRAIAHCPGDAAPHIQLGTALADAGDTDAALAAMRRCCELVPDSSAAWFNLGKMLRSGTRVEESLQPLQRALTLAPDMESAHFLTAEVLTMLGRTDEAVAQYRELLKHVPQCGLAWWGLANLKIARFEADDLQKLRQLSMRADIPLDERIAACFALAKALEDQGMWADAYASYVDANALARRRFRWNAEEFSGWMDALLGRFDPAIAAPIDGKMGEEVIFMVGMPRSGSTLVEQIVAAHGDVEGGSELTALPFIISEESRRRGRPFPDWVPDATRDDWLRLGQRYLERTASWRARRPRFTDKTPSNWMLVGAIRAMLPGARIVDCRRDALETCWSCFRQIFWSGHEYSYDFEDLADYRRVYVRAMQRWRVRHDSHIHEQVYESLVADPDAQTRALLDACGLSFDPACLRPHEATRSVRTASAAQVRQPIQRDTARLPRYGALLDPLRQALERRGIAN